MTTLKAANIKCNGCVSTIKNGLSILDGVQKVEVDLATSIVTLDLKNNSVLKNVKEKLTELGYPAIN